MFPGETLHSAKTKLKENRTCIILIRFLFLISRLSMYLICYSKTGITNLIECIQRFNTWDSVGDRGYISGIDSGNLPVHSQSGLAAGAFFPSYPLIVFCVR